VDRSANTTPGNKAGGLSNIVEKAMGSIVKSGSAPIAACSAPGERLRRDQRGLVFAATPASDFICGTLQLAAGMNLHVFTTGRGTPYGLAECPVIKVATRTDLARRWHDLMDLNAGRIADGELPSKAGLGTVPPDARRGQRPPHLGRTLEAAQRPGAVQPGPVT
jgi:galactarate dehydratase